MDSHNEEESFGVLKTSDHHLSENEELCEKF